MRPIVILSLLTVIFAFLFFVGAQIGQDPRIYLDQAQKAYQEKNWEVYLQCCQKIHDLRPRNPQAVYNLAGACALAGKKEDAIVWLKRLSDLGLDYGIGQDPDFESLRETPEFKAILDNLAKMKVPVSHSQVAFQVSERDLIPESIAYDAVKEEFFLGSLYKRKIIKVDKIGRAEEFTSEGQDGLWSVIGIKVDAKRRILWAASAAESIMKGFQAGTLGYQTGIFKYDLRTKKLIQKYLIENPREKHLFNDLVVNVSGDVFITDYFHGAVWRIAAQKDKLELFVKPDSLAGANGIALSADEKYLFLAYTSGVAVFEIQNKRRFDIDHAENMTLAESDGLYFFRGSLIAVQTAMNQVNRFFLSPDFRRVERQEVLEAHNAHFDMPTTGVLVDNTFYHIANSQYASFDEQGNIFALEKLKEVVILKIDL